MWAYGKQTAVELRATLRAAKPHILPLLVLGAMLFFLYRGALAWLTNAWLTNDYYSHGFLVVPVALFFMWRRRALVQAAQADPLRVTNLWLLAGALVLYGLAFTERDPFLFSLSLVGAIAGMLLYVLGLEKAKPLMLPVVFLLFAVPLPNLLWMGGYLQQLAVWGTTKLLALFGTEFVQDDITITTGGIKFEVAPLCSGLSSVLSITMVATVIAATQPLRDAARLGLVLAAIPLALVANILRIALTIAIAVRYGPDAGQGFFHGASDIVLFLLALSGVLGILLLLRKTKWSVQSVG